MAAQTFSTRLTMKEIRPILEASFENQLKAAKGELPGDAGVPYIQGPPGMGKTQIIKELAKEKGYQILSFNFGMIPYEAVSGIPDIKEIDGTKITDWTLPRILDASGLDVNKPIILIFDDWHNATQQVKKLAFELFTDRSLNGHKLPDQTVMVCLGNETKKAGMAPGVSAVTNRMIILKVKPDVEGWVNDFARPNGIHPAVISFVEKFPEHVNEEEAVDTPFGTLRSITAFANMVSTLEAKVQDTPTLMKYIRATLGGVASSAAVGNFQLMYEIYAKFDADRVIKEGDVNAIKIESPMDALTAKNLLIHTYIALSNKASFEAVNKKSTGYKANKEINKYTQNLAKFIENKLTDELLLRNFIVDLISVTKNKNNVSKNYYNIVIRELTREDKKQPVYPRTHEKIMNILQRR